MGKRARGEGAYPCASFGLGRRMRHGERAGRGRAQAASLSSTRDAQEGEGDHAEHLHLERVDLGIRDATHPRIVRVVVVHVVEELARELRWSERERSGRPGKERRANTETSARPRSEDWRRMGAHGRSRGEQRMTGDAAARAQTQARASSTGIAHHDRRDQQPMDVER